MKCPVCQKRASCIDTRSSGQSMRRRYRCVCGERFSTKESFISEGNPVLEDSATYYKDGKFLRFESMRKAAEYFNVSPVYLRACARKSKDWKGGKWI